MSKFKGPQIVSAHLGALGDMAVSVVSRAKHCRPPLGGNVGTLGTTGPAALAFAFLPHIHGQVTATRSLASHLKMPRLAL